MPDTPTIEPTTIGAGDTVTWLKTVDDYPPADGWVLTYKLRSATVVYTVTCTTSGTDYLATITAAASAAYVAGPYSLISYVTRTVDEVLEQHTIGSGTVTVTPNLTTSALADPRTDARIIYDNLITGFKALAAGASHIESYNVAGRGTTYRKMSDMTDVIQFWYRKVRDEENAARVAQGQSNPRRVGVRFNRI